MDNQRYWENRAVWNTFDQMEDAEKTADEIAKIYRKASLWLTGEARDIFERYMMKHRLSEIDALNLLNTIQDKTSIQELLQKLRSGNQSQDKKELLAELEAPAYRARIERLQNLQSQVDQVMQNIYQVEKDISTKFYTRLAEESYYKAIFEIQKRTGLAFSFSHVDSKQIDRVLSLNWSGQNYSKRIWKNTDRLAQTVKEELMVNLITGRTEREAAEQIALRFGQGSGQARRLVRTESSFVSGQLNLKAYEEAGIEWYRFLATLDLKTSKICRELDGEIFKVSEAKVGVNHHPMHPWCRSTTISVVDDETLSHLQRRARDPVTGKTYMVPANMTYKEWYQKYVVGGKDEKELAKENRSDKIKLSEDEQRALNQYISSESYKLNDKLRRGLDLSEEDQEMMQNLDAALDKMPEYQGVVYRSVSEFGIDDVDGFMKTYEVGQRVVFPSYLSSSKEVYDKSFPIQYEIQSKHGKDILVHNSSEQEILFKRNSSFRVLSSQKYEGFYFIRLEEE